MDKIKVLPAWAVLLVATGVAVVGAVAVAVVLMWLDLAVLPSKDRATVQLDALRIGLSIGVGSGGVFALYLAARRQRATELDLAHKAAAQMSTDADATERRITELYTKAAEQLGGEKAVVRLAGLYAMERLAQANPEHRQTIVEVLCGYLRMPLAVREPSSEDEQVSDDVEELQVRMAAQLILHRHLTPVTGITQEPNPNYWGELDLNLTGATLVRFWLGNTSVGYADFRGARFIGTAQFQGARLGSAMFRGCQFDGAAWFESTSFGEAAIFDDAVFMGDVTFENAVFGNALFDRARFGREATFDSARFVHNIQFEEAVFDGPVSCSGARVRIDDRRSRVLPTGWAVTPVAEGCPDRIETLMPQRWKPRAAVSVEERGMSLTEQVWGHLVGG
ncbi:pentapeptide repeat-containing protein [Lentzea sp. NPDC092896]|uniref:pentapeptide repeat-containing protein n=1 Tax=Lentzea sp. NPDC092896 TaxID=3364127 RepID=UPI0037F42228